MATFIDLEASLDQIQTNMVGGSQLRAISNLLYGFNARHTKPVIPIPKDGVGYVFFTRPMLNLSDRNITNSIRKLFSLLEGDDKSFNRYVRMMLDPRLFRGAMSSPFVNNSHGFIPLLTNTVTNVSGWLDLEPGIHTSTAGGYGEEQSYVDGPINDKMAYDLTCTFRTLHGHPHLYLFAMWVYYQELVSEGVINPRIPWIFENEIDYNTRIYRLNTDVTKQFLTGIACCGASFPVNIPTGQVFDFDIDKPLNGANNEMSFRFRAMGFRFNDDLIKLEFNQTQALFNPAMRDLLRHDYENITKGNVSEAVTRRRTDKIFSMPGLGITKVPHHLAAVTAGSYSNNVYNKVNFNMYPYINLATDEIEWWVPTPLFTLARNS